ncbi:MAG TPA: hypothetical protein VF221_04900 [Chloroflexota bacterium]
MRSMVSVTAAENISARRQVCDEIEYTLEIGAVDRGALARMMQQLSNLGTEIGWEVRGHLTGRNRSDEMLQAERWLRSARETLQWAERHAVFALCFELARAVEIANESMRRVLTVLEGLGAGAAA